MLGSVLDLSSPVGLEPTLPKELPKLIEDIAGQRVNHSAKVTIPNYCC